MRKKYPSQIRYEKNNPTITFRMSKEEKERIEQMAVVAHTSVSDLVRMALFKLEKELTDMYQDAYDDGFESGKQEGFNEGKTEGANEWAIWVECWVCHEPVWIEPDSNHHQTIQRRTENYIAHPECNKL